MLAETGHLRESAQMLMECRKQGDTKSGLIEFLEGTGTYLAAFDQVFSADSSLAPV